MKMCKDCGNKFPGTIKIDGKQRNLKNRTRCLDCLPFGQSPYRKKTPEEKRSRWAQKARRWRLREKQKLGGKCPIYAKREARKKEILALIGSKCQFCGYNKCDRNLAFHHVNEKEKRFRLSSREFQFSMEKLIPELMKCVVTCHNCHGEIHEGLIEQNLVEEKNKIFAQELKNRQ